MTKKKPAFKEVLEGHKKEGKLFRAFPYDNVSPLSYLELVVPELLIIHLLNTLYGPQASEEIFCDFNSRLDREPWAGAASIFAKKVFSNDAYSNSVRKSTNFKYFDKAVAPLAAYYPTFPLTALVDRQARNPDWLVNFKPALNDLYDKRADAGAAMLGVFVLVGMNNGDLHPTNFLTPSAIREGTKPGTREEGASVRASLGAVVGSLFGCFRADASVGQWSQSFWQQGFEIEEIDWSMLSDEA